MHVVAGSCIYVKIDPAHAFVVVSDPEQADEVLCVNFTTYHSDRRPSVLNDPACIICAGSHPFITNATCMCYGRAITPTVEHWHRRIDARQAKPLAPVTPELLAKIREGALNSEYILPVHGDMLVEQNLV